MINISILDDHQMVLQGLVSMIESSPEITVMKSFSIAKELLDWLAVDQPDILLLDINLPDQNGIDVCKIITKKYPLIKVIGLSNYSDSGFVKSMIRNGAKGYLLKNISKEELIIAIQTVNSGMQYLTPSIKENLLNESFGMRSTAFIPKLTRREKEVLQCISEEMTNSEMATKLFISIKTVESHRNNLIQKLGVRNTAGLIKEAILKGLIK